MKNKNLSIIFLGISIICFIFFTTACGDISTPMQGQLLPESPSATPTEQIMDPHAPVPKISVGQNLRFERISLEQGLSQSTVFCILQDSQGFMWFGTEDGLNKYDGYNFTIYKNNPEASKSR